MRKITGGFFAMRTLMHKVYWKRFMRGYLKYLRNQHRGEVMVTTTVSYATSSDKFLQGKGRTVQRFYKVDSWNLLWLGEKNKRKVLDVTPNDDLRQDLAAGLD